MEIKIKRTSKLINNSKEIIHYYSIEPKEENYEITLLVIENWKSSDLLIKYAKNRIGYCDSDNGFGIAYKEDIDFETQIQVLDGHLLVFANYSSVKEFIISEINYLKILLC